LFEKTYKNSFSFYFNKQLLLSLIFDSIFNLQFITETEEVFFLNISNLKVMSTGQNQAQEQCTFACLNDFYCKEYNYDRADMAHARTLREPALQLPYL